MKKLLWETVILFLTMKVLHGHMYGEDFAWEDWFCALSGPLTPLLLPTCHDAAARLRYRYSEIIRNQIDWDFRRRGLVISDELHQYYQERMTRRFMILYWMPDGMISGYWNRHLEDRKALEDYYKAYHNL